MALNFTLDPKSKRLVDRAMARYGDEAGEHILPAALKAAEIYQAEAQSLAPRLSGRLQDSIEVEGQQQGQQIEVQIGPNKDAFYGLFQEFGTDRHPPQPFLRPAFDGKTDAVIKAIAEQIKKELGL